MINTSNEFDNLVSEDRTFNLKADVTFVNDVKISLDDADIMQGGMEFEDAVSGNSSFQIGTAIINKHTLTVANYDGKFDGYDFDGATVVPYVGLELSNTIESLKKGLYTVDESKTIGDLIILECLDNMHKFEKPFTDVGVNFPTSAISLLSAVSTYCGVVLNTPSFTNSNFIIQTRPESDALSCLDIVSYIAQIAGCFARCNVNGALELKWYDLGAFEQEDSLDGGHFDKDSPYSSGDNADGGNFLDYNSGGNYDGGTFLQTKRYWHLYDFGSTPTVAVDDVVITGIKVENTDSEKGFSSMFGSEGYVLGLINNPLVQNQSEASVIASSVGAKIVGMKFRPFSSLVLSNPAIEAGDPVYLSVRTSRGYNTYQSFITNVSYKVGSRINVSCNAETPSRKSSTRYSTETKAIVKARNEARKEIAVYDLAVQQLNSVMTNAMGYYPIREEQEDGSYIDYMCDKPTLAESKIIWKKSIDGFAISDDGGITWTSGMTKDGNIIARTLSVIGINADWIEVKDRFKVGTKFEVDSTGKLRAVDADLEGKITADSGQIGPFKIDTDGLKSNLMEFFEDNNYPLIWLKKKGANGSEHGEGGALGNYEPSIVNLRSTEDGDVTSVSLMARKRADNNKKGTLSISNNSGAIDLDQDGLQILKYGDHSILINKSGIHVSNDVLGGTCEITPYGSIVLNYGGSTFSIHNSLNSTSISTSSGGINFGDDLRINSKSGGDIILNGVSVNAIKQRLGL